MNAVSRVSAALMQISLGEASMAGSQLSKPAAESRNIHAISFARSPISRRGLAIAFAMLAVLSACASSRQPLQVERLTPGAVMSGSTDKALVFGKVALIGNSQAVASESVADGAVAISVFRFGLGSTTSVDSFVSDPDGRFYAILPSGQYIVDHISTFSNTVRPELIFTVPGGANAVYLGALNLRTAEGVTTVTIVDEFDAASDALRTRNPGLPANPTRQLITQDAATVKQYKPAQASAASGSRPAYCNQSVGERTLPYWGNPALLGPALIVSALMGLGC